MTRSFSLKTKFLGILAIPVVVLIATTLVTYAAGRRSDETLESVRHSYAVREQIGVVLSDLVDAESSVRGYLLTKDDGFLGPYTRAIGVLPDDLVELEDLSVGDPVQLERVDRLRTLIETRLVILDDVRRSGSAREVDRPYLIDRLEDGRVVTDRIREMLGNMDEDQTALIEQRERSEATSRRTAFLVAVLGMPIGMLASLVIVLMFNERIVSRLSRVEDNARRLDDGDPMLPSTDADDEIGRLGRAVVASGTRVVELRHELERLATVDHLTGLMNRRGLLPVAEHQLELSRRQHEPLALLFIDADGLKQVNDTLGHGVGDDLLCELGALIRDSFRASDVPARLGGDEFCVLLTADSASAATTALRRLLGAIETANRLPDRPYRLSISTGIAYLDPEHPRTFDELIDEADRRMYADKRRKRSEADAPADIGSGDPAVAPAHPVAAVHESHGSH